MSTIQVTPSSLEFSHRSIFAPAGCTVLSLTGLAFAVMGSGGFFQTAIGVVMAGVCGLAATAFLENVRIRFDLSSNNLSVYRKLFRTTESYEIPLKDIRAVRLEYSKTKDSQTTYRACLVTSARLIPMTTSFSTAQGKDAEPIHRWLVEQGFEVELEEKQYNSREYRA